MTTIFLPFVSATDKLLGTIEKSIVEAEWQKRREMKRHSILMKVAEERARFICNVPDIFVVQPGHIFPNVITEYGDGDKGPNWWAAKKGYIFPDWYPKGDDVNTIESFASGYQPSDIIDAWLRSPAHYEHLTGNGNFFGNQVHYGIGVWFVGKYSPTWVFISAH